MEYTVEDLSPVKKKITVTVPVEEVNAALAATIAVYRSSVNIAGFRKGKVPASVIEGRFRKEVYNEATQDLVNVHINEIVGGLDCQPASRIDFDGGQLERDKSFVYSISFEVMPAFDLPAYEGLEVEQEKPEIDEKEVAEVLERIRTNLAEAVPVAEHRSAKDGEIAVLDFAAYDEAGEPLRGVAADNFELSLGNNQALPDFEELVKKALPGEPLEGTVAFPNDFINAEFAGKSVTMKLTVHAVKERRLPELDDDLAKKAGGFESFDKMRETVEQSYLESRTQLCKAQAQKGMVDKLLAGVEFPVPDSMLELYMGTLLADRKERLERQGKNFDSLGKSPEELREDVRSEAEHIARTQILLVQVAQKEGLAVTEQEVDGQLQQIAMRSGQDFQSVKEHYSRTNMIFNLRDRMLADKAMEAIYEKAAIKEVPADKVAETPAS